MLALKQIFKTVKRCEEKLPKKKEHIHLLFNSHYSFLVWQNCYVKQIYVSLFDCDSLAIKHKLTFLSVLFSPFPHVAAAGPADVGCPAETAAAADRGMGGRRRGERREGGGGGGAGGREGGTVVS